MWEYATYYAPRRGKWGNVLQPQLSPDYDRLMREMGEQGWELVSATPQILAGTSQGDWLYFKRQKATATP